MSEVKCKFCHERWCLDDYDFEQGVCANCTTAIGMAAIANGYAVENRIVTMNCPGCLNCVPIRVRHVRCQEHRPGHQQLCGGTKRIPAVAAREAEGTK
jgi:hypothetical protein